jgi:sterol desaturase/sphingolipid hydroxylase (fatty acid hydroxylase superfamily)
MEETGMIAIEFFAATLSAFIGGTFVEYFIHRGMHWGIIYPKGHQWHHESNEARTFFKDMIDYGSAAAIVCWVGFLVSVGVGIGWAFGCFLYAALASYAHQLQHANAGLVFWMPRPVHRLHHVHDMTGRNFGVLVDWWDRLFGTYEPIEWPRQKNWRLRDYADIPWK